MDVRQMDIWGDLPYLGALEDGFRPLLTTYLRGGDRKRGLVLVLPGGGYGGTSPREAEPIALAMNQGGYHALVLDYSVAPRRYPQGLLDVARVLTMVKENQDQWLVDMDQLFVIGFSAGGHLAATVSNQYKEPWLNAYEGIDLKSITLEGVILSYPVITGGQYRHEGSFENLLGADNTEENRRKHSMENLVNAHTPRTFLWHTVTDGAVPVENALLYVQALQEKGISYEVHLYPDGGHGLSLATKDTADYKDQIEPHVANWMALCLKWMAL